MPKAVTTYSKTRIDHPQQQLDDMQSFIYPRKATGNELVSYGVPIQQEFPQQLKVIVMKTVQT